ncbi:hypothetical protein Ahia01_000140100 [Argonauta hians]
MSKPKDKAVDIQKEYYMHLETERLQTFTSWPFQEGCSCTPEAMAAAGFYYCGSDKDPDYVRCFACQKELDGWEPQDDPWLEHKSHSKNCKFVKLKKLTEDLTLEEFFKFMVVVQKNRARKKFDDNRKEFETLAQSVREKMEKIV